MQVTFYINELKEAIDKAATELFEEQREALAPRDMNLVPTELELILSKETDKFPLTFRFKLPD